MAKQFLRWTLAGVLTTAPAPMALMLTLPQSTPAERAAQPGQGTVTVEGCLVRGADVPERKTSTTERAGAGEEIVLTSTVIRTGAAPSSIAGVSGVTGTYGVKGLSGDQLRPHLGERVQIDGVFENRGRQSDAGRTAPVDDWLELRATAIRRVAGACGAKP